MKRVQRFVMGRDPRSCLLLPRKTTLLTATAYQGELCLYALVDTEMPEYEQFDFIVKLTEEGFTREEEELIMSKFMYLGTVIIDDMAWHVWGR